MGKLRTAYLVPPHYDIDALLASDYADARVAYRIIDTFWGFLDILPDSTEHDYFRPDSALLYPEVMVRDIARYDSGLGNGFGVQIHYSGGLPCFFRGLRALRTIGHKKGIELAEGALAVFKANGVPEYTSFPDDPVCGECPDWPEKEFRKFNEAPYEVNQRIIDQTRHLDSQWWALWHFETEFSSDNRSLPSSICDYLNQHRQLLRSRKMPHRGST
jgi:hypothetical protein